MVRVSILKEIPCKRTFGAEEPIIVPVQSPKEKDTKSNKKETKRVKSVYPSHKNQTDEVCRTSTGTRNLARGLLVMSIQLSIKKIRMMGMIAVNLL
jgi:hypothetical protein